MVDAPPNNIEHALSKITSESKLTQKYYLSAEDNSAVRDDRSALSDAVSFRSTSNSPPAMPYHDMNHDQRFNHLSSTIDTLEK